MTKPDEALIWARERAKRRVLSWPPNPQQAIALRVGIDAGKHDNRLADEAQAYRAGQAASAERIKALEEALRGGLSAVSESYRQAVAEVQGYDRVAERHDQFVVAWKAKARALLKEADQ